MAIVEDIAFTAYPAKDVAALARFYSEHLGLTFENEYAEEGVKLYCEAQVGTGWFALMTIDWMGVPAGSCASITFEVADIETAFARLRKSGIPTEEIHDLPACKIGSFRDAEGNKVTLHQARV